MSIQIASLFAAIGADTTGFERGLGGVKSELQNLGNDMRGMPKLDMALLFTGLNQAMQLAQQVGQAFQNVYGIIKEGAALDSSRVKFDRLTTSIGTTSDALMNKLRVATRGLRSDADLMAGASDFMSLGFAKNTDDVVRLTNVAGALGMNMNQLVLTLANQTTMRFDQLGLAVDGFDAKVERLKDTGMSTSDAFQEAFLQQAEEQIGRLGNVADTSAGKLQRIEAAVKNVSDSIKQNLAEAVLTADTEMSTLVDSMSLMKVDSSDFLGIGTAVKNSLNDITILGLQAAVLSGTFKQFGAGTLDTAKHFQYLNDAFISGTQSIPRLQNDLAELNGTTKEFGMMIYNQSGSFADYIAKMNEARYSGMRLTETTFNLAKGFGDVKTNIADGSQQLYSSIEDVAIANGAYSDLYLSLFDVSTSYDQFKTLVAETGMVFGYVTEGTWRLAKGLGEVGSSAESASSRLNAVDYSGARYEAELTRGTVNDLTLAYRDLDTAKLGVQGEIVQNVVLELETRYKKGAISEENFLTALANIDAQMGTAYSMKYEFEIGLKGSVDDLVKTILTNPEAFADKVITVTADLSQFDQAVLNAKSNIDNLETALKLIERTFTATVNVNVSGGGGISWLPDLGQNDGKAVGGPAYTNSPYIVGERGPELFVPHGSGYIMTNSQTDNMFNGGSSDLSEVLSRIPTARDIATAVRDALLLVSG